MWRALKNQNRNSIIEKRQKYTHSEFTEKELQMAIRYYKMLNHGEVKTELIFSQTGKGSTV